MKNVSSLKTVSEKMTFIYFLLYFTTSSIIASVFVLNHFLILTKMDVFSAGATLYILSLVIVQKKHFSVNCTMLIPFAFVIFLAFSFFWNKNYPRLLAQCGYIQFITPYFVLFSLWLAIENGIASKFIRIIAYILLPYILFISLKSAIATNFAERLTMINGHPNALSLELASLAFFILPIERTVLLSYLPSLIVLISGSLISGSRQSLVPLIILLLYTFFLLLKQTRTLFTIRKLVLISVFIFILYFISQQTINLDYIANSKIIRRTVLFFTNPGQSESIRMGLIQSGLELFSKKPLFGHGLDAFHFVSGFQTYAHNNYIELLVNYGLVGFSIYYSLYVILIYRSFKMRNENPYKANVAILFLLSILITDFADVSYQSTVRMIDVIYIYYLTEKQSRITTFRPSRL